MGPPFGVSQTYIWGIISIFIQNTSSSAITVILGTIGTVLPKLFEKWCGYSCTFPSAPARSSHLHRWVCVTFCVVQVLEGLLRLCRVWKAFKRFLFSCYWQTLTGNDIGSPNFMPTFAAPSDLPGNMFQWMPLTRVMVLSRFLPPLLAQSCLPSPRLFSSSEASAYLHYGMGQYSKLVVTRISAQCGYSIVVAGIACFRVLSHVSLRICHYSSKQRAFCIVSLIEGPPTGAVEPRPLAIVTSPCLLLPRFSQRTGLCLFMLGSKSMSASA